MISTNAIVVFAEIQMEKRQGPGHDCGVMGSMAATWVFAVMKIAKRQVAGHDCGVMGSMGAILVCWL